MMPKNWVINEIAGHDKIIHLLNSFKHRHKRPERDVRERGNKQDSRPCCTRALTPPIRLMQNRSFVVASFDGLEKRCSIKGRGIRSFNNSILIIKFNFLKSASAF